MNDFQMTRRTMGMLVLGSLAACGGGGSGAPELVTGEYRLKSFDPWGKDRAIEVCNEMGALGYAYVSSLLGGGTGNSWETFGQLFVKDSAHAGAKLEYTLASHPDTLIAGLEMFNALGKQGFLFKSFELALEKNTSVMVRDVNRAATFAYAAELQSGKSLEALTEMLARQGRAGFRMLDVLRMEESFYLFAKDESIPTTYEYIIEDAGYGFDILTKAELQKQFTAKGQDGWLWRNQWPYGQSSDQRREARVYERKSTQRGDVEYVINPIDRFMNAAQLMEILNVNAAQGFFWFGHIETADEGFQNLWVRNGGMLTDGEEGIAYPW